MVIQKKYDCTNHGYSPLIAHHKPLKLLLVRISVGPWSAAMKVLHEEPDMSPICTNIHIQYE